MDVIKLSSRGVKALDDRGQCTKESFSCTFAEPLYFLPIWEVKPGILSVKGALLLVLSLFPLVWWPFVPWFVNSSPFPFFYWLSSSYVFLQNFFICILYMMGHFRLKHHFFSGHPFVLFFLKWYFFYWSW